MERQVSMGSKHLSRGLPLMLSGLIVGMSTTGAYAYLDAGTGSIILQVLLGGVAGLAIAGKLYWHRFLTFLRIRKPEETEVKPGPHSDARIGS